jgi:hypothetical protein
VALGQPAVVVASCRGSMPPCIEDFPGIGGLKCAAHDTGDGHDAGSVSVKSIRAASSPGPAREGNRLTQRQARNRAVLLDYVLHECV